MIPVFFVDSFICLSLKRKKAAAVGLAGPPLIFDPLFSDSVGEKTFDPLRIFTWGYCQAAVVESDSHTVWQSY